MESWFDISENNFNEFCTTSDKKVRNKITNNAFSLRSFYCQSKTRILCELLYQILEFCSMEKLSYQAVNLLLVLVSTELHYLTSTSSIDNGELKRVQKVLNAHQANSGHLLASELKRLLYFYTERFLKTVEMYNYILHYLQYEIEREIFMEVETPTFTACLHEAEMLEEQKI